MPRKSVQNAPVAVMPKVFISHSHLDKSIVIVIADRLKNAGCQVWIDRLIQPGDNFQKKIQEALYDSDVLIIVIIKNSFKSKWVQYEFSTIFFQDEIAPRRQRIIPVKIDQVAVPDYMASLQYLDLSVNFDTGMDLLINELSMGGRLPDAKDVGSVVAASEERGNHILRLREALRRGRLTLVCGAGVSVAAGIPSWNDLLLRLLDRLMKKLAEAYNIALEPNTASEFQKSYGTSSSLILGKYLKNNLGKDFALETRSALYAEATEGSELIKSIVRISRPQRDAKPLDSIITFNFDCLIEEQLNENSISNKSIFSESVRHDSNELPIYHVHGYLPRAGEIPEIDLVFSEDAYHGQFIDSFSWSNLMQLNKLTQNTCLFIGISLTDPNMRRLLDVAWRKNSDKSITHFIVRKRTNNRANSALDRVASLLEEQDANALGLNII